MNGFIALAPLSRITQTKDPFLTLIADDTFTPKLPTPSENEHTKAIFGPYDLA